MLTVTFAFVVATALFLFFKQTRWMGVVGVFVLLCLSPLVFGAVVLLAALLAYLAFRQPKYELIPKGQLPGDAWKRRRNGVLLLGALGIGGALALGYSEPTSESAVSKIVGAVRAAPRSEVIVLRTPGGLLEVSRIEATEMLDATIQHEIFGIEDRADDAEGAGAGSVPLPHPAGVRVASGPRRWRVHDRGAADPAEPAGGGGLRRDPEGRGGQLDAVAVHRR